MTTEFEKIVSHFSDNPKHIIRGENKTRHSPVEIELLNGLDGDGEKILEEFFGEPVKASGYPADYNVISNPVVRKLGGAYVDQTVYLKQEEHKKFFYAALWPWHIHPGVVTLHLGIVEDAPDSIS